MIESMLALSMILTPIVTYFLARRSIKSGIRDAYEDIMSDIMSEETIDELKTITRSVIGSATGTVGQAMPKFDIKQIGLMIALGLLKDKIPFLKNIFPQLEAAPPAGQPVQELVYDPSRRRQ